ncbi:hypothetical protein [Ferviditalea candida]|uniref:Uncharacterized protein n=1 Tax=Ferviditalea candida TaxID=3108399 RepID=A0ABU5ZNK0_9BACL|nr:hypothetical protein [Paenibacillaceae bacterium T2]
MAKPVQTAISIEAQRLGLSPREIIQLFSYANEHKGKTDTVCYHPRGRYADIVDDRGAYLGKLPFSLPEEIRVQFKDKGAYVLATALLPREYSGNYIDAKTNMLSNVG